MAKTPRPGSSISAKPSDAEIKKASRGLRADQKRIAKIGSGAAGIIGARKRRAAQLGIVLDVAHRFKDDPAWKVAVRRAYKAKGIASRNTAGGWTRLVKLCIPGPATNNSRNAMLIRYARRNEWTGKQLERRLIKYGGVPGLARHYKWKKLIPATPKASGAGR